MKVRRIKIWKRLEILYKIGALGRSMNCALLPPLLTPHSSLLTPHSSLLIPHLGKDSILDSWSDPEPFFSSLFLRNSISVIIDL